MAPSLALRNLLVVAYAQHALSLAVSGSVAEIESLRSRGFVDAHPSPIGTGALMTFVPHPEFFVDDGAYIESAVASPTNGPTKRFHRAGPRRTVAFAPGEVRAAVATCGGVCPGLNTVVREIALCLRTQYGVESVSGVRDGYAGFAALE